MKYFTIPFLLLLLNCSAAFSQESSASDRKRGQILIQIADGADISTTLKTIQANSARLNTIRLEKAVAREWGIYLINFTEEHVSAEAFLEQLRHTAGIRSAQLNHRALERDLEPNDPDWPQQGDMTLINAPLAWETSTGGVMYSRDSIKGDTIVVAVLEKGTLFSHPDLAPNRWWNWQEGSVKNGVDDDGNGYIDDFGGWNPRTQSDDTGNNGTHGTAVNGIVGAQGNNNLGVTGVNWNVKLMNLANVEYEDEIIEAYQYVGAMRRLYNQTNGARGAFVVATNASFGLNQERPEDHPVWCAMYDSLGVLGVLGVGATTNENVNVDQVGDIPTACASEFLISVNNINKQGNKMSSTGYGQISIDLGAPGHESYTTINAGNDTPGYGTLGGTSAAAPHVTGAIGLLYSLGCKEFTKDALSNPVACARRVRDAILNHVQPNPTLNGLTSTGGHLDLAGALQGVQEICDGAVGPLGILEVSTMPGNIFQVRYQTPIFLPYTFRVYNMLGQMLYDKKLEPQQFGENFVEFNASYWPRGIYVMAISRGDVVVARKFPKI